MRNLLNRWTKNSAIFLGLSLAATGVASAQAMIAAGRGAEIAPFASTTLLNPDWGPTRDIGFTVGVDYTRFTRSLLQPSLELRMTHANGLTSGESSYTGGFKLGTTIGRFHPYGTLLAGTGTITFVHPQPGYGSDNSFVYSIGGGADFPVGQSWKVRADFVQQHWDLDPQLLTPVALSIGVSYSIPFRGGGWVR